MFNWDEEWNISFAGCGFRSIYYLGALSCILQQAPQLVHGASKICGASSGCLVAAALTVGIPIGEFTVQCTIVVWFSLCVCCIFRRDLSIKFWGDTLYLSIHSNFISNSAYMSKVNTIWPKLYKKIHLMWWNLEFSSFLSCFFSYSTFLTHLLQVFIFFP